jgi:hypothetical protein
MNTMLFNDKVKWLVIEAIRAHYLSIGGQPANGSDNATVRELSLILDIVKAFDYEPRNWTDDDIVEILTECCALSYDTALEYAHAVLNPAISD